MGIAAIEDFKIRSREAFFDEVDGDMLNRVMKNIQQRLRSVIQKKMHDGRIEARGKTLNTYFRDFVVMFLAYCINGETISFT